MTVAIGISIFSPFLPDNQAARGAADEMYPWYRDSVGGQLGQLCGPMATTIKTENGYNDCMLALDYATQSKVGALFLFLSIPAPANRIERLGLWEASEHGLGRLECAVSLLAVGCRLRRPHVIWKKMRLLWIGVLPYFVI